MCSARSSSDLLDVPESVADSEAMRSRKLSSADDQRGYHMAGWPLRDVATTWLGDHYVTWLSHGWVTITWRGYHMAGWPLRDVATTWLGDHYVTWLPHGWVTITWRGYHMDGWPLRDVPTTWLGDHYVTWLPHGWVTITGRGYHMDGWPLRDVDTTWMGDHYVTCHGWRGEVMTMTYFGVSLCGSCARTARVWWLKAKNNLV